MIVKNISYKTVKKNARETVKDICNGILVFASVKDL